MRGAPFVLAIVASAAAFQPAGAPSRTKVVMLGTGTPRPDPAHSGPATAIVVDDRAHLVDAGPGVVRRAAAAAAKGISALAPQKLDTVFITHLHSDHTVGLPDVIFTPWVQGRRPIGVRKHLVDEDIALLAGDGRVVAGEDLDVY